MAPEYTADGVAGVGSEPKFVGCPVVTGIIISAVSQGEPYNLYPATTLPHNLTPTVYLKESKDANY